MNQFIKAVNSCCVTGFIWATTGVMAADLVSEREQGQLAGVNVALGGLMSMLGPLDRRDRK